MRDVFTPNLGGEYTGARERIFDRFAMRTTETRMRACGLRLLRTVARDHRCNERTFGSRVSVSVVSVLVG